MARKTIDKPIMIARLNDEIERYDDAVYRYYDYARNAETLASYRYWSGCMDESKRAIERIRELIADIEKY